MTSLSLAGGNTRDEINHGYLARESTDELDAQPGADADPDGGLGLGRVKVVLAHVHDHEERL